MALFNSSLTVFSKPYERQTKAGEAYERQEGYTDLQPVVDMLENAVKQGHTVLQVLPRAYKKDSESRLAIEVKTFKGKDK